MTKKQMSRTMALVLFVVLATTFLFGGLALAETNVFGLDGSQRYDIYVGLNDDNYWIVQDVVIVDFRVIKDITFVVIQGDTFNVKASEGLILLSSIRAIIPSRKMVITPVIR
jgi:hypothetical protein